MPADLAELKHEVRDSDLQKLMLSILQEDEGEPLEPKSSAKGT